jgi:hypothetical protein
MMHAGHPLGLFPGVFDIFILIEFPDHISVPVYLYEIGVVLNAVLVVAFSQMAQDLAAGEKLVGKTMQAFPELDFGAIHIDEQSSDLFGLKKSITVETLFRDVDGGPGRVNAGISHKNLLCRSCYFAISVITI